MRVCSDLYKWFFIFMICQIHLEVHAKLRELKRDGNSQSIEESNDEPNEKQSGQTSKELEDKPNQKSVKSEPNVKQSNQSNEKLESQQNDKRVSQSNEDNEKEKPDKNIESKESDELQSNKNIDNVNRVKYHTVNGFDLDNNDMEKFHIWPAGIIPYYIDDYSYDKVLRDRIRSFLDYTNHATAIRFNELARPLEDKTSRWVFFVNRRGQLRCEDHPFKNFSSTGVQRVVLGYDCLTNTDELAKTVLSLVGVPPQHNAPNRDEYIVVNKANIKKAKLKLFKKLKDDEWIFHGIDYDFNSAGHFGTHKYTINGGATIEPKIKTLNIKIGGSKGFSPDDILKINLLYAYISKNKRNDGKAYSNCQKLFMAGEEIENLPLVGHFNVAVALNKPNKYLGLPDEIKKEVVYKNNTKINKQTIDDNVSKTNESNRDNLDKIQELHEPKDENHDKQNITHTKILGFQHLKGKPIKYAKKIGS